MRSVIICQGASSAVLYVQECWKRGLEPIVVNCKEQSLDIPPFEKLVGSKVRHIDISGDDYKAIFQKVRGLDPAAVVCGAAGGVELADKLARDLGLPGNDPVTTYNRDFKDGMHRALKDAGLRYIKTARVNCAEDIERFWKAEHISKSIIKFANGAGSVGNRICHTVEEAVEYYRSSVGGKNMFGIVDQVLIQEFIEGDEYVVDTVSCKGRHVVAAIWKYNKVLNDNHMLYDETRLVVEPQPETLELVRYAFGALDATGFEYGPCHGEYKIDENGPVLIETNPRPHGTTLVIDYLDECLGNHIADIALDAYLSPDAFMARERKPYRPRKYAAFKHLISLRECDANLILLSKVLNHMESFRYTLADFGDRKMHIPRTVDGETTTGIIKLCNDSYRKLRKDCDFLTDLETKYFDILISGDMVIEGAGIETDIRGIADSFQPYWSVLLVKGDRETVYINGEETDSRAERGFDAIIYADARRCTLAERFDSVIAAVEKLCDGGRICIVPEVYRNMPRGSAVIEMALYLAGCTVEIQSPDSDLIVGTKA